MTRKAILGEHTPATAPSPGKAPYWDRDGLEALLAAPWPDNGFGLLLVSVLTGLRIGELYCLTLRDVHVDARDRTPYLVVRTMRCARTVPLHPALVTWLVWWKAQGWRGYAGRDPSDEDPVFPDKDGKPRRPQSSETLRRMLETLSLPSHFVAAAEEIPFNWHATRRTFSKLVRDAGAPDHIASRLLGDGSGTFDPELQRTTLEEMGVAVGRIQLRLPPRHGCEN